jgi:hypothetical protein
VAIVVDMESWWIWLAALVIVLITGKLGNMLFQMTASNETIRADLEERTRNPPS